MMNKIQHFFNNTMIKLGYYDWKLEIVPNSHEGYCWRKQKKIQIGEKNKNPKRLVLHEISHIDTCRYFNNKHCRSFWIRYEELMRRFLPDILLEKRYHENVGIFGVCF